MEKETERQNQKRNMLCKAHPQACDRHFYSLNPELDMDICFLVILLLKNKQTLRFFADKQVRSVFVNIKQVVFFFYFACDKVIVAQVR